MIRLLLVADDTSVGERTKAAQCTRHRKTDCFTKGSQGVLAKEKKKKKETLDSRKAHSILIWEKKAVNKITALALSSQTKPQQHPAFWKAGNRSCASSLTLKSPHISTYRCIHACIRGLLVGAAQRLLTSRGCSFGAGSKLLRKP